jgi:antitoxin (DNA-binding transcriptional repressor) of toxin-antitoxin stability system
MNIITTTQLRTQTSQLIRTLAAGKDVTLIHRSKIVGKITAPPTFKKNITTQTLSDRIKSLHLKSTTPQSRDSKYREQIEEKYGQNIPGR